MELCDGTIAAALAGLLAGLGDLWSAALSHAWAALDPSQFEDWLETYPHWAPLIAIAFALFVSLTPLPMETIAIVNGMWFGPVLGSVLTLIGALIAAMLAFFIAKLVGLPLIKRILPDKAFAAMGRVVEREGVPTLIMIRMIPLIPFTVINYGAGVTTLRWQTFLWTSAVGMTPPTILFVTLGDLMLTNPVLAFGGMLAMAITSFTLARKIRQRRAARVMSQA